MFHNQHHPSASSTGAGGMAQTPYAVALNYPEPAAMADNDPAFVGNVNMYPSLRAQWQPILTSFEGGCSQDSIKAGRTWIDQQ